MTPYYLVNTYFDHEFIASSDVFYSKSDALEFKQFLDEKNTFDNKLVYCTVIEDNCNKLEAKFGAKLEAKLEAKFGAKLEAKLEAKFGAKFGAKLGLKIYNYGEGYILKCPEDNVYYGMNKFEDGLWGDDLGGWYFSGTCDLDRLSKLGIFTGEQYRISGNKYNLRKRKRV